ncbi:hypothetical protein [Propionicimonas sp.]|uniref:hypothetical protein n=1 Tax=Propionicimonas sp. TaxID=1955623 RepID=UPI001799F434|nr:hypothetical protein [Propionicimonas sp.]MBU3977465.1 hypothetical protein [Actinomycetota bacterium]MBA3021389.1 hypothetical protein [Propionicimonas sp.]MBU3985975.1 hypothetical protein [Actinomycetota bacterium]MBU4008760.1 hypothetical protein [Actinomycetota bacterium]MBU4066090.1 hypothetical protein [Actinomycetota bacterium]
MTRRQPKTNRGRAWWLLAGGAIGGVAAWSLALVGFGATQGTVALASAALAGVTTLAFFALGQLVQVSLAEADPMISMMSAMLSYVVRVGGLVLVSLVLTKVLPDLNGLAVALTVIAVALGWIAAEIWAFTRLRIPAFDPPQGQMH